MTAADIHTTATIAAPPVDQIAPGLTTRVREGDMQGAQKGLFVVAGIALLASIVPMFFDGAARQTALYSYLTAYMFTLSIALGALFFVMIQHISRAGWSVVVRRVAENMAGTLVVWLPVLFLPIAVNYADVWHHWTHAEPGTDAVLDHKRGYLNTGFFFARAILYFVVWALLARSFRNQSLAQDQDGDPQRTLRMARLAAPGLLLAALTTTFAAFDWIMSLDPHWFSTIFGLIYFGGGIMATLALMTLAFLWFARRGYLATAVNQEHYHDLGKLMFAFMVFWAYTSFAQYMLIWYANLPEETMWFQARQVGSWQTVFTVLAVGHFIVPLAFLMSRHTKRNRVTLGVACAYLLVMHWLDMAYQIMPNIGHIEGHEPGFAVHWTDPVALIGVFGLFLAFTLASSLRTPLVPERDPRLAESLHFHNI